jgi:plasmid stability protein
MKRLLVQLDERTYQKLRQRAFRQERSMSAIVRDLIVHDVNEGAGSERPTSVTQLASVRAGRSKQARLSPVSERHDEALAAALEE